MIFDKLKNAPLYYPLGGKIEKALKYLETTNFDELEPGKYEIDGDEVYALVQSYNTKPSSSTKWEAHKKYIDIQYLVEGKEKIGFTEAAKVILLGEYDEEKDYMIYKGEGNYLIAEEKHFAIFYPSDIHMPSIALNIPKPVRKVVVKVKVDEVETAPAESPVVTEN